MLRNIPNKVDQTMLKRIIDESSWGKYDFMYLRIDFANDCKSVLFQTTVASRGDCRTDIAQQRRLCVYQFCRCKLSAPTLVSFALSRYIAPGYNRCQ